MQAHLTSPKLDELLLYTKGCPNRWFEHTPLKLKLESSKSESNIFNGYVRTYIFHASSKVFIEYMTPLLQR